MWCIVIVRNSIKLPGQRVAMLNKLPNSVVSRSVSIFDCGALDSVALEKL